MFKRGLNKKAQDLSIGTLILIVLGIVVLVLLILGFSLGWSNLWEKINIFQGGSSLESVIQACNIAVASNSQYTFCQDFKKVKVDGKVQFVNCQDSRISSSLSGQIQCTRESADAGSWYCSVLNANKQITSDTKVNNVDCVVVPNSASAPEY
ncbi:MAG: hypothetical protein AABY05_01000 [Nanoarchaeota archaeon]